MGLIKEGEMGVMGERGVEVVEAVLFGVDVAVLYKGVEGAKQEKGEDYFLVCKQKSYCRQYY